MLKVFMSYAAEDRAMVRPYFARLAALGLDPWMDCEKLLPGQQWEAAILRAFREAHVVVLFMSPRSVKKRGFVTREANEAIQNLRSRHRDDIYVIPLMIETCDVPEEIAEKVQYLHLSDANAWQAVSRSLMLAAEQQEIVVEEGEDHPPFKVFTQSLTERTNGKPGHDLAIDYPRFICPSDRKIADELSALFAGRAASIAATERVNIWSQYPGDDFWADDAETDDEAGFSMKRNGRWDSFTIANANVRFLSLYFTVSWYGSGAAHGNHFFETFNFAISNGAIYKLGLLDFFASTGALDDLSAICRREVAREHWRRFGEEPDADAAKWIAEGCAAGEGGTFTPFIARADGFTFLFAPYQVGPYAAGSWSIEVPYHAVSKHLRPNGPHTWAQGGGATAEEHLLAQPSGGASTV